MQAALSGGAAGDWLALLSNVALLRKIFARGCLVRIEVQELHTSTKAGRVVLTGTTYCLLARRKVYSSLRSTAGQESFRRGRACAFFPAKDSCGFIKLRDCASPATTTMPETNIQQGIAQTTEE